MRVNKNLLLQKTDKELEDYLKPNKGYVTDAIEYAVEILTKRGYEFSEEQKAYIETALTPEEKKEVHKHYITASNFIFASAALGAISFLIASSSVSDYSLFNGLISLLFVAGFGLLARTGTAWLKYVLLAFLAIALIILPFMTSTYKTYPFIGTIAIFQSILELTALVFLFIAPIEKPKIKDIFEV